MHKVTIWLVVLLALGGLIGCTTDTPATEAAPTEQAVSEEPAAAVEEQAEAQPTAETADMEPLAEEADEAAVTEETFTPLTYPENWQDMPVIPVISDRMRAVYERGIEMGNDPYAFSVVGDCQNVSDYFLADYATPGQYNLGEYEDLQETIDYYVDSFSRERAAVRGGYNVASVLSPMWADPEICEDRESPLACEYRLQNPSIALISMETWWYDRPAETYANYLRQIVEYSLGEGVVPILATKADNLEEDHKINAAIVQVAQEYDVPLWNFWAAVQPLPGGGLTEDAFHLTYARPFFNEADNMQTGWAIRNLTALQALDAVRRGLTE